MDGLFDDLVPKKPAPAASGEGLFDDLVPQQRQGLQPSSIEGVLAGIQTDAGALPPALGDQVRTALASGDTYDIAMPALGDTHVHTGPTSRGGARHPKPPERTAPDYRYEFTEPGNLGEIAMRAIVSRAPDILANVAELPATVNDAVANKFGVQPGFLDSFRALGDEIRGTGFTKEMDAIGYGQPSVGGGQLVDAIDPRTSVPLGERASTVAKFVPETLIASAPDMAATLDPATLVGYIGGRTNEVAKNRAANDMRDAPTLGDLAVAAPAATLESLLERFTTMRLLPHGTTLATPGIAAAIARIGKELGIQSSLGGIEELAPYLAENAGTEEGATARGAAEQFAGGALAEGLLGAGVQGGKEALAARSTTTNSPRVDAAPESAPPGATARPSPPTATAPEAGQTLPQTAQDALQGEQLPPRSTAQGEAATVAPVRAQPAPAPVADAPTAPELAASGESAPVVGAAPAGDGVSASPDALLLTKPTAPELPAADAKAAAPVETAAPDVQAPAAVSDTTPGAETAPVAANEPRAPATSTKNAVVRAEREAEGRDPVLAEAAKTNESTLQEAQATLEANPSRGREVVERLKNEGTSGISLQDEAVLLVEKSKLRTARDAAATRASDPAATEEARAVAKREFDEIESRINDMDQATLASGREWGRLGQFRQRMLREDFSFEALERKERVALGRPLSLDESHQLKVYAERIQKLEGEAAVTKQQLADAHAELGAGMAYKALLREMAGTMKGESRPRPRLERLRASAEESRAALAKMGVKQKKGQTGAIVNPAEAFYHLARIGAYHVANGVTQLADFVARMKAELSAKVFGEVEPQLPDVFTAAKAIAGTEKAQTPEQVVATIEPGNVTHKNVVDLARAHVLAGVQGEGPVMAAVHQSLQAANPDISERQVRQLFADYGQAKYPSRAADKVALRELRALVQLQESIDRLAEGQPKLPTGPQRDKATAAIVEKRKQLDAMLRAQAARVGADPEQVAAYQAARAENLRQQIAQLQHQIDSGERPGKRTGLPASEEVRQLEAERDRLREQLDAIDHPKLSPEERYQRGRAASIAKQLADVQARLAANDYSHRTKPEPRALNESNTRAHFELEKAKAEFAQRQFDHAMAQRSPLQKVFGGIGETLNLARAINTSIDLSAVFRQGGAAAMAHPVLAARSILPMLRAFRSEQAEFKVKEEIRQRETYPLYKKFGLELTLNDEGHSLSKMEEAFMSRWVDRIPKAMGGGLVRGSGRAYTTFLNKLRADVFDSLYHSLATSKPLSNEEGKAIANFVNVATGRGSLGKFQQAATLLNTVFFAPKLVASRFQLLLGQPALIKQTPRTRALVTKEYARMLMGFSTIVSMLALGASAYLEDDDKAGIVSLDPKSTDFLKIRAGHTYIDPMAGLSQAAILIARTWSGEKTTNGSELVPGKTRSLTVSPDDKRQFGAETWTGVLGRFLRTKLAPIPGALINLREGQNVVGDPVTPLTAARDLFMPMSLQNTRQILTDNGLPAGAATFALNLLGVGVQYREDRRTTEQEVDSFKKLGIVDKLAAFDHASEEDRKAHDLRGMILKSQWQEQVAKLPKAEREQALAAIDRVRDSFDQGTQGVKSAMNGDGSFREIKPATVAPAHEQLAAYQVKAKAHKLERELRTAFASNGLDYVNAQIEKHRDEFGADVWAETTTDENGVEHLVLHGLRPGKDESQTR